MPKFEPRAIKLGVEYLSSRILIAGCAILLVAGVAFSVGSGIGFAIGRMSSPVQMEQLSPPQAETVETENTSMPRNLDQGDLDIFWEAMDLLERDYYGSLPSPTERGYGAIRGVLDLLNDPNTSFLTPEQAQTFLENIGGSFEGIGATVNWADDIHAVRIVEPFENQPAWNAGLRRNDLIIAIDGTDVADMADLTEAVNRIRGPEGSTVKLTILRGVENEPFTVEVVRDFIQIPVVFSDRLGENQDIIYIRLSRFSSKAGEKLREALQNALEVQSARGVIFDMRGNPGGLLSEAVNVASLFLPDDEVVLIERYSNGTEDIFRADGEVLLPSELPMVVLVNEGTASASEIVSGALQDIGRAVLIGTTTFGKGSVQLPHHLSDGSLMRVTIARWYTPENRSIDGTGLEPDIVVEISNEEIEADQDPQLERALQLLETGQ